MMRHAATLSLAVVLLFGTLSAAEAAPAPKASLLTRTVNRLSAWNAKRLQAKAARQEFAELTKDVAIKGIYKAARREQHIGWLHAAQMTHQVLVGVNMVLGSSSPLGWINGMLMAFSLHQYVKLDDEIDRANMKARSNTVARAISLGREIGQDKLQRLHDSGVIDLKQVNKAAAKIQAAKDQEVPPT
jgi:hypothetical protein